PRTVHRDFMNPFAVRRNRRDQRDLGAPGRRHLSKSAPHLAAREVTHIAHRVHGFPGPAGADQHAETFEVSAAGQDGFDDGDDSLGWGQTADARLYGGEPAGWGVVGHGAEG